MTGRTGPDFQTLKLEFGTYVQLFEPNDITNTTQSRSTGAIARSHTGNSQGDYFFMSLVTKKRLARHAWTVIPITASVIAAVEHIAEVERQPLIEGGIPVFELIRNVPMGDLPIADAHIAVDHDAFETHKQL